jgi:hypothetical protein
MDSLSISKTRSAYLFLATLAIYIFSYWPLGVFISYCVFATGLLLIVVNFRIAVTMFFMTLLLFDDINKFDNDLPPLNTIFTLTIKGYSVSLIWTVLVFLGLMIYFLPKKLRSWRIPVPMTVIILFCILGLMTLYQYRNDNFISDIGFVLNIIVGFLIGQAVLTSEQRIRYYFAMVVVIFLSKFVILSLDAVLSSIRGIFYGFKAESGANYLLIPLVLILLFLFYGRHRVKWEKPIYLTALVFLFAYLFITISRERILLSGMALLGFLVIYKQLRIVVYFSIFTILTILAIKEYNSNMYAFVNWKLTTFMPSSSGKTNPSSTVRFLELKNIWAEQLESPHKLFIGTGWGGYFTSRHYGFSKKILGTRSYPDIHIERDQFFRPHGTYLYLMLKYGTLGVLLFYASLVVFSIKNIYDRSIYYIANADNRVWLLRYIQISLAFSITLVSLVIFTSKLQIMTGFFIAMLWQTSKILKAMAEGQEDLRVEAADRESDIQQ